MNKNMMAKKIKAFLLQIENSHRIVDLPRIHKESKKLFRELQLSNLDDVEEEKTTYNITDYTTYEGEGELWFQIVSNRGLKFEGYLEEKE